MLRRVQNNRKAMQLFCDLVNQGWKITIKPYTPIIRTRFSQHRVIGFHWEAHRYNDYRHSEGVGFREAEDAIRDLTEKIRV